MKKVVIIYGPTGVGKTSTSIKLAQKIGGEIISADSMQVYKNMDIGTAKITKHEMCGVKHYMLSIISPKTKWTVYDFVTGANAIIEKIIAKGKIPIVVGGTGLYLKALIEGYDFEGVSGNCQVREKYNEMAKTHGNLFIYELLKQKNPEKAAKIKENDTVRIVRALEIEELAGQKTFEERKKKYDFVLFALMKDREKLYKKINSRVNLMFKNGLKNEVKNLLDQKIDERYTSMQAIGYKELLMYFRKELTLLEAKELIKKRSRNYAKRQITFLNSFENVIKIDAGKNAADKIEKYLKTENLIWKLMKLSKI